MNTPHHPHIEVTVRYPAVTHPFVDPKADPADSLGHLKARVLLAFGLEETHGPGGSTLYFLYHGDQKLENLNQTLAEIAGSHHELKLKLVQQIVQGESDDKKLDAMCLANDFAAVVETDDAKRWKLTLSKSLLEVRVAMSPAPGPKEEFLARLLWGRYPHEAPSLKFVDPATDSITNPNAWPQCAGFRPSSLDACVSWTKEGYGLHPEWIAASATKWDSSGNPLFRVLNILQDTLDYQYSERFK